MPVVEGGGGLEKGGKAPPPPTPQPNLLPPPLGPVLAADRHAGLRTCLCASARAPCGGARVPPYATAPASPPPTPNGRAALAAGPALPPPHHTAAPHQPRMIPETARGPWAMPPQPLSARPTIRRAELSMAPGHHSAKGAPRALTHTPTRHRCPGHTVAGPWHRPAHRPSHRPWMVRAASSSSSLTGAVLRDVACRAR